MKFSWLLVVAEFVFSLTVFMAIYTLLSGYHPVLIAFEFGVAAWAFAQVLRLIIVQAECTRDNKNGIQTPPE